MSEKSSLQHLLEQNASWAKSQLDMDPDYFNRLAAGHHPKYLWIGCSDARVPANTIIGIPPGDVFVHRNVGNVVSHGDMNVQAVIRYAVEVLKVEHVIVTGHYDCGAIKAVLSGNKDALSTWLYNIANVVREHRDEIVKLSGDAQVRRLVELNAMMQARHVAESQIVKNAWKNNQKLSIHGWVYSIQDGLLKDLGCTVSSHDDVDRIFDSITNI